MRNGMAFDMAARQMDDMEARQVRMLREIDDADEVARGNAARCKSSAALARANNAGLIPAGAAGCAGAVGGDDRGRGRAQHRLGKHIRHGRRGHQESPCASRTQAQHFPTIQ